MKVLLVEDDPKHAEHYRDLIVAAWPQGAVRLAFDCIAVDAQLVRFNPDVVVVDIWLGGPKNGREIIKDLRAARKTRNCVVYGLTSATHPQTEKDAMEAGCDAFFRKTRDDQRLAGALHRVGALMARRRRRKRA